MPRDARPPAPDACAPRRARSCDHAFCNGCILNWAKQKPKCPLCQTPFTHLWLYRQLDGSYNDFLVEESVDMLLLATWFRKQVITRTCDVYATCM